MGYGGKIDERRQARELRAKSWTLLDIARKLGVSKSSVSVWVRDVEFVPKPRNRGHSSHKPHPLTIRKQAELERCRVEAEDWIGGLSDRDLRMFALALYAGEGSKGDGGIVFANSDPTLMRVFVTWMRREFPLDEGRFRVKLYLHADLDVAAAVAHWSTLLGVPACQFNKPYRAVVDETIRHNRHVYGCASIIYHSRTIHRSVMAMITAITSPFAIRDSSVGRASDC